MEQSKKRLGELVIRSENPQKLVEFYQKVIGLELFARLGSATFLKVADDFEGHPQLLVIFDMTHKFSGPKELQTTEASSGKGTLHHFAFALERAEFDSEYQRLTALEIKLQTTEHKRFGWRSLYLYDPDGNSVELVCFDPAILVSDQ